MDFPVYAMPSPPIMTTFHPDMAVYARAAGMAAPLSTVASSAFQADTAYYYPFRLTSRSVALQLLWFVGSASSGNIDMGIYDSQGNLIVSKGATAMSATTNTVQELNISDTVLAPGDYLLAGVCDSNGTCFRLGVADEDANPNVLVYQEDNVTSAALQSFATNRTVANASTVPLFVWGIQLRSVF